jgi:FKBP-type peptidyl-prolyl cis-trans isomerase FkpA
MKQTLVTFLLISAIGLASCRKDRIQPTIAQYDQQQITNYISAHGLTGMVKDNIGTDDTSGIWYQIISPGTQSINGTAVTPLDYPSQIAFVYTERTLDGTYVSADTVENHFFDYVGHIYSDHLPYGLQIAVHNLLKYPDATMRVLIPSHLAYGISGSGSGSSQVANNRIGGNECLDFYIHAVNNFQTYDDLVIKNYMRDSSLTGYTPVKIQVPQTTNPINPLVYWVGKAPNSKILDSGTYYYKIITPATSTSDPITYNSTITTTYTGTLFNATDFNDYNVAGGTPTDIDGLIPGVQDGMERFGFIGQKISFLIPSQLGYALSAPSGVVPPFSCLRFTFIIDAVTP